MEAGVFCPAAAAAGDGAGGVEELAAERLEGRERGGDDADVVFDEAPGGECVVDIGVRVGEEDGLFLGFYHRGYPREEAEGEHEDEGDLGAEVEVEVPD